MSTDDPLLDMPPDEGAGRVPPLMMAAELAGVELRRDPRAPWCFFADKLTEPEIVLISVGRDGYTVRRRWHGRWKTLCKDAQRTETVIKHVKEWT